MERPEMQNAIRVNMRGFLPSSSKRFVLCDNKTGSNEFTVTLIHGEFVEHTVVFSGKMTTEIDEFGEKYQVGDFSEVRDDGDYYVTAGGYQSRKFVIYDRAYDNCQRHMLEYYTYQRCGHPLGWNGKCHTDDGYIKETGEHVDLSGGYHQSCDLRKSPGGVSIGVLGMLRAALADKSEWGEILFTDEARWACDYFVKTIQQSGAMYNTMNDPFGWGGRVFYKSAAPSSAQWCVTSILALGYLYFKERDAERAERYLSASLRSYEYLTGDTRPKELYRHPDKFQRGFDTDDFYCYCQKDSTADRLYRIMADSDLYHATADEKYQLDIKATLPLVLEKQLDGKLAHVFHENFEKGRTVGAACNYTWAPAYPMALVYAYDIVGDVYGLGESIRAAADAMYDYSRRGVWHYVKHLSSDADLDIRVGHPEPGKTLPTGRERHAKAMFPVEESGGQTYYGFRSYAVSPLSSLFGAFLVKASKFFGEKKYAALAQDIFDTFLGVNAQDSSRIRGIGYNHVQHRAFGQFFPSTPFIPGAIGVGYSTIDVYSSSSEYDMPCVGNAMHFVAELSTL